MSRKVLLILLAIALSCALTVSFALRWLYPFGRKAALLPSMWGGLAAYATDHGGWFPYSAQGSYPALAKLYYLNYCTETDLAGVSGSIDHSTAALRHQSSLSGATSWVYFPGLRIDDPGEVAILWERSPGYYWNGKRNFFGGRPVLFANGAISNIAAADWPGFLGKQEQLRRSTLHLRIPPTNGTTALDPQTVSKPSRNEE